MYGDRGLSLRVRPSSSGIGTIDIRPDRPGERADALFVRLEGEAIDVVRELLPAHPQLHAVPDVFRRDAH